MNRFNNFILQLSVIFLLCKSGLAIKCYHCDSKPNPGCVELKSSSNIKPQECRPELLKNETSWLQRINKIDFYENPKSQNVKMLCQKIVAVDNDLNDVITLRTCQIDGAQSNPCDIFKQKLMQSNDPKFSAHRIELKHCSVCYEDNCNAGNPLITSATKFWTPFILIILTFIMN